jgi:hypothetical protein
MKKKPEAKPPPPTQEEETPFQRFERVVRKVMSTPKSVTTKVPSAEDP